MTPAMTADDIRSILADVRYLDWEFQVGDEGGRAFLQVRFHAPDAESSATGPQHCRKWMLSPFMTRGEVVQTALLAVLTAVEHEARERFTYQGQAVFGPHFDLDALLQACREGARQVREGSS